jgi:hypothetical protein
LGIQPVYFVQEFLERGVYKSSEVARKEGAKKESRLTITRTIGRAKPLPYEITDKTPEKKEDWERVVAVFVTGATWQFKGFPDKVTDLWTFRDSMSAAARPKRWGVFRQAKRSRVRSL